MQHRKIQNLIGNLNPFSFFYFFIKSFYTNLIKLNLFVCKQKYENCVGKYPTREIHQMKCKYAFLSINNCTRIMNQKRLYLLDIYFNINIKKSNNQYSITSQRPSSLFPKIFFLNFFQLL